MSNLRLVSNKALKTSSSLLDNIKSSYIIERRLESISLQARKKLIEKRRNTLNSLNDGSGGDGTGGLGGLVGSLVGGLTGGSILRRFRGGGGPRGFGGPRGGGWNPFKPKGPRLPSNNIRPTSGLLRGAKGTRGFRVPGLKGLRGGIGPLAVLTTGLDFMGRKAEGQTNLQAGVGAGGGLAGALAGGAAGAKAGAVVGGSIGALFGGVGAAPGAAIGGFIGGVGGSIVGSGIGANIADFFTGADNRRQQAVQTQAIEQMVTPFSIALDKFDEVLNKLQRKGLPGSNQLLSRRKRDDDKIFGFIPKAPSKPFWDSLWFRLATDIGIAVGITLIPWDAWFGDIVAWAKVAETARKIPLIRRLFKAGALVKFNKPVTTIVPATRPGTIVLSKKGELAVIRKDWFDAGRAKAFWRNLMRMGKEFRTTNFEVERRILDAQQMVNKIRAVVRPSRIMRYLEEVVIPMQRKMKQKLLTPGSTGTSTGGRVIKKRWGSKTPISKADGGPVIGGKPYRVGEIGEELFIPSQDGVIVPNWALDSGPITIVNNNGQTIVNSPIAASSKGGGGGTSKPNPYVTATKYAQMTSLMTV